MKKRIKVGLIHSIVIKILWCVVIGVCATWLLEVWTFLPLINENIAENAENYMYDMAVVYGRNLEEKVAREGKEQALAAASLSEMFKDVRIKGAASSYAYITDAQGIMLYHPTADKIGQSVENEVVKGLVGEISQGRIPEPAIITYNFKGVEKYASYYVGGNGNYILVITADESEIFSKVNMMMRRSYMSGILVLVVCGLLGFGLGKLVVRPINMLAKNVLKLAEMDFTADETQEKLNRRKDETGQMSRAISGLREELVKVYAQIKKQSRSLYEAAETLSGETMETSEAVGQVDRAVGEIADGATSQAEETQKATENVILIGSMVEETGEQVSSLNSNADAMQRASVEALETLKELDQTNVQTREAIEKISEQTNTTNESALKIREATTMITSIAEETNLLSLNASIEAARAGEQGRGFAVVASQIQKLAEQSNESAREIEEIIDSLIRDSEEAVETMDSVREIIARQSANVERTGMGFAEVKKGIDTSLESISAISNSISRMDEARVNVVDVVQNLTAIAEENAAGTEETSASATEVGAIVQNMAEQAGRLKEVAGELESSMSVFKV
ncbi:MAG: methyl-accepting chemotaxis protein [Lachnospiraceae bacterium]|nr:methyl-accepting chemotaxis protein [Lachnospiraceae bacterium]MBD5510543.1 methyl-accepting chemotaxis protein [Lachnospiraceae bacterium]